MGGAFLLYKLLLKMHVHLGERNFNAAFTELGVDFLLPADEYFVRAERALKPTSFYGDFSQIENGVGMTSKFHEEFFTALDSLPEKRRKLKRL